jgi:hypothetical protein
MEEVMKSFRIPVLAFLVPCLPAILPMEGCLFSGHDEPRALHGDPGKAKVRLSLLPAALVRGEPAAPAKLDSVHIRVTGEDMAPMEFSFSGDSLAFDLEELPAGTDRVLTADLFRQGRLLYSGKGTYALTREARAEVDLRCDPQFSRVTARFHLPVGLPAPIYDGSLKLQGGSGQFTAKLRKQGEFGSFTVDEIPGDVRYDVAMALADSGGKTRYEANRAAVFLPLGEEAKWDLALLPTQAQAGVALSLAPAKVTSFTPGFPSRRRRPAHPGEALISEFYPAPSEQDSSTAGEWFELFNRTADTLALRGCRLSRDRSGGVTRSLAFDSAQSIAPGRALVFGRSASAADVHYADFTLVNTASSLLLLCSGDSLVLDSLRYSPGVDSSAPGLRAVPVKDGWVTGLDADSLGGSRAAGSWCMTKTPSPGQVESCPEGG